MRNTLKNGHAAVGGVDRILRVAATFAIRLDARTGMFWHFAGTQEWIQAFWRKYLIRMFVTKRH